MKRLIVVGLGVLVLGGCNSTPSNPTPHVREVVHEVTVVKQKPPKVIHETTVVHDTKTDTKTSISSSNNYLNNASSAKRAVEAYYDAAEGGDWRYTYDQLYYSDRARYTYDQWVTLNYNSGTASSTFQVDSIRMFTSDIGAPAVEVVLSIYAANGDTFTRTTYFYLIDGKWEHVLTDEERAIFDQYLNTSSTTSSSPTSTPAPSEQVQSQYGGDVDCDEVNGPVLVGPDDPNNLDGDGDGIGCE